MEWGQTSLGFELLWGSGHNGGYPALHLLRQVVSGLLQTKALVTWGVVKEADSVLPVKQVDGETRGERGELS